MPLVHYTRGGFTESSHLIEAVAVDRAGRLILAADRPGFRTFWRSGAKPFQVIPFISQGGMERFGLTEAELAVMVSSHSGEAFHTELVRSILAKMGLSAADLQCGAAQPLDAGVARDLYRDGIPFSSLHNDCSGKHSAMMGLSIILGEPLDNYISYAHPVQSLMRVAVAGAAGVAAEAMEAGVDGCGVPTYRLPLVNMALAYARLAMPEEEEWGGDTGAIRRIRDAMCHYPGCVGGTGRFETVLMEITGGRLVAKLGAEASYCIGSRPTGEGLAMKVVDGGMRALPHFGIALLLRMGWISSREADALRVRFSPAIINDHGWEVGRVEVELNA